VREEEGERHASQEQRQPRSPSLSQLLPEKKESIIFFEGAIKAGTHCAVVRCFDALARCY
jgi:hypothetical protein